MSGQVLIESICWKRSQGLCRLNHHLNRLAKACQQCAFYYDGCSIVAALDTFVKNIDADVSVLKIRLLYSKAGITFIESEPYALEPGILRLKLRSLPVKQFAATDFLCKFSDSPLRAFYNAEKQRYPSFFDVIYCDNDYVTEGSKTNIYVDLYGELLTPPLMGYVLPGTYRQLLIEASLVREKPISVEMLRKSKAVYVSNALIGIKKAFIAAD